MSRNFLRQFFGTPYFMMHAVEHLVEALRYKPEDRGFDSRCCHWNYLFISSFRPQYGPGVDSVSNENEYQGYFLRGKGGQYLELQTCLLYVPTVLKSWSLSIMEPSVHTQGLLYFSFLPYIMSTDTLSYQSYILKKKTDWH